MNTRTLKFDGLLLLASAIWGLAFVAQRVGMGHVGPFTFNGIRFALGSLALVPLILARPRANPSPAQNRSGGIGSLVAGTTLFAGASFQQAGLVHTTAGKAGFITGLYVVIVPVLGWALKRGTGKGTWLGALLAATGLYLLTVTEGLEVGPGDLLELAGAFFWALHVLILARLSPKTDTLRLAFLQFVTCSLLSLLSAWLVEEIRLQGVLRAGVPILYGGLMSVGVAYTLQVLAQKRVHPSHAAVILSLEAVFAAVGGWLILEEGLSTRGLLGCALMLLGMGISRIKGRPHPSDAHPASPAAGF